MLYLAEVQKKSGGLLGGGGKAELRLLACQRSEQNWSSVSGDEVIPSDEANSYGSGALVLVDLSANRQVQRLQEASRPLVSILQNFSRLQEKFKTQEEEIEQWKQSLTYQSQELNRREMEMEARREQLQQMEEDFEQMEQQRQEIIASQEEINQQKEAYDRNRQELEGAWDHLRGETRRLEEQQATMQQSTVLDDNKARTLQEVLNRLTGAVSPVEPVRDSLNASFEILSQHQERLNHHWQTLEQQRSQVDQSNHDIEQQAQNIRDRWQEWHQAQTALEQAKAELKAQQTTLIGKQDYTRLLSSQLHSHDELHQQVYRLAATSDHVKIGFHVNVEALEKMPMDDLQKVVQDLENELLKLSSFVESQEEELRSKQQEIDDIKAKVDAANEYDRLNLENEMSDEQDGYQMLYETLVGQRRSLQERKAFLNQHQSILRRRQGLTDPESNESVIDLEPILTQIDAQRQQQADELQALEAQITQIQAAIQQTENIVNNQATDQEAKRNELKRLEDELLNRRKADSEVIGKVATYQEMLQPIQDTTDGMRQKLEAIAGSMAQGQEAADSQQQAITEIRQVISSLTNP
ncbi:MAG: pilus motility taxis protein HmpF [Leptolyngbyaceae cyanobacterium CAN_BIN12]|nr:pilus motility taxis protein HmpF [Leptolyngbyaceae cyanobacterium CAN_BIN12]